MTVTSHALGDDLPFENLHRRKQSGGAMSFVIMSHRAAAATLQRQTRLCTIECLDLRLLISREDKSAFRRVQIQPDHVDQFFFEMGIVAQLERARSMRLESIRFPHALHRLMRSSDLTSQCTAAPMRRIARLLPGGLIDDLPLDLAAAVCRTTAAGRILFDTRESELDVSLAPLPDRLPRDSDSSADLAVLAPLGCQQNNVRSQHQTSRRSTSLDQLAKHPTLAVVQRDDRRSSHVRSSWQTRHDK